MKAELLSDVPTPPPPIKVLVEFTQEEAKAFRDGVGHLNLSDRAAYLGSVASDTITCIFRELWRTL